MARVCSIKGLSLGLLLCEQEGKLQKQVVPPVPALLLAPGQLAQLQKEKVLFGQKSEARAGDALVGLCPKAPQLQLQSCAFPLKYSLLVEMQMLACPKVYDCLNLL